MSKLTSDMVAGRVPGPPDPTAEAPTPVTTEPVGAKADTVRAGSVRAGSAEADARTGFGAHPITAAFRGRPSTVLIAGLGVLLLALWVGGGLLLAHNVAVERSNAGRAPALAAAQKVAADLTSVSAADVQQRVQSLTDESTGNFHKQISTLASALQTVLSQAQVGSQGTVGASGIERIDQTSATALVAVTASVSGGTLPNAEPISYRIAVQLQRENGRWLTSDVTFVQ